ncbi:ABC transporter ATP-binding protein [Psychrobacter sp. I-STPA10]|uniref:ABC transporter ATP-binding protein n=1 Tax=Psychrobacter sp. I-STPA10 TaxID=2585769 RepID=UPI001E44B14C|nr:ABC transporter ATP-binding protein [Psychrobacter sp. I-STPA10]
MSYSQNLKNNHTQANTTTPKTLPSSQTNIGQLWHIIMQSAGEQAPILKRCIAISVLTAVLRGMAFTCFIPLFLAVASRDGGQLLLWAGVMSVLIVLSSISDWFSRDYDYKGHAALASDTLRRQLGQHLRRIPLQKLYAKRSGELTATIAGNVDDVIQYTMILALMLIAAVVTPIVVGLLTIAYDWRLGVAILLLFPSVLPIYFYVLPRLTANKQKLLGVLSELSAETVEYLQGLPVLKATGSLQDKASRYMQTVKRIEQEQITAMKDETLPNLALTSAVELGVMLIVALGLWLVSQGDIQLMLMAGLLVAVVRFAEPLSTFISMMSVFEMVRSGYARLQALLAIEPLPQRQPIQTPDNFNVHFEQVSFAYENSDNPIQPIQVSQASQTNQNAPVLNQLSLDIPANAMTALVGASGCGKTTLIRLLMRYADPQQGSVSIGGVDIRNIEPEQLNHLMAVVFQDVYLFDDTIIANIRMGRQNASDEEVIMAAKSAQCHDFIEQLPDGYQTRVGDIGNNLSGGEKQRLSIARALLKDAPIIILDEPTAALDTHSERAVQKAIDVLVQNKTVIVIAHRLSTIVGAKNIVVLDNGTVAEQGTHQQLLAKQGIYAKLWGLQGQ